jgi:hypothetical protein
MRPRWSQHGSDPRQRALGQLPRADAVTAVQRPSWPPRRAYHAAWVPGRAHARDPCEQALGGTRPADDDLALGGGEGPGRNRPSRLTVSTGLQIPAGAHPSALVFALLSRAVDAIPWVVPWLTPWASPCGDRPGPGPRWNQLRPELPGPVRSDRRSSRVPGLALTAALPDERQPARAGADRLSRCCFTALAIRTSPRRPPCPSYGRQAAGRLLPRP